MQRSGSHWLSAWALLIGQPAPTASQLRGPHPADWLWGCGVGCLEVSRTPSLLRLGLLAQSNYLHEVEVIIIYSDVFQDEK